MDIETISLLMRMAIPNTHIGRNVTNNHRMEPTPLTSTYE
jgi:hypothetical protein